MRKSLLPTVITIVLLLLAACQQAAPETVIKTVEGEATQAAEAAPAAEVAVQSSTVTNVDPKRELRLVAVVHALCAWDAFWCTEEDAIRQAATDFGVQVDILGPDSYDLEKVAALIDQAVATNPDGIAVTVTDADLFREPLMRAINAGIPVVAFNAGSGPEADGIPYLTLLAQDEYQAGYQGGKRLVAAAQARGGGKLGVCINHGVGSAWGDTRCNGFADALDEAGIPSEVVGIQNDPAEAATIIGDYYTANADADIFLTLGPNGANPFYSFVDNQGLTKEAITHGTFDLSPEINAHIEEGLTQFGVDQQPFLQGYGAIQTLVFASRYGILPALPVTATGPGFVTKDKLGAEPDPAKPMKVVAVVHALCAWDAFWCVEENALRTAAENLKIDLTILGPDSYDLEKVAALIDQAVATNPDGIAVTVTDADLFREPLMRAINAGIPVVAFNAGSGPEADGIPYLTLLAQDEYQAGYQGGKRLVAAAQARGGGKLGVCINHGVGSAWGDTRCNGFADALDEAGIPAEVVGIQNDPAEAATIIGDYYTANADADIFLTLGPNGANPFYSFVDNQGLTKEVITHGTFDLSPEINAHIEEGLTQFGVDQQPFLQGYGAVQVLSMFVRQGIAPALPIQPTGPGFVTKEALGTVQALAGEYR